MKTKEGPYGGIMQFNGKIFELYGLNENAGLLTEIDPRHSKGRNCPFDINTPSTGIDENFQESNFNAGENGNPCMDFDTRTCLRRSWRILIGYTQATLYKLAFVTNNNPFLQAI